jgi:hypothetical protein
MFLLMEGCRLLQEAAREMAGVAEILIQNYSKPISS